MDQPVHDDSLAARVLLEGQSDDPWQVLLMVNIAMSYLAKGRHLPKDISAMPPGWQTKFRAFEAKLAEAGLLTEMAPAPMSGMPSTRP